MLMHTVKDRQKLQREKRKQFEKFRSDAKQLKHEHDAIEELDVATIEMQKEDARQLAYEREQAKKI